MSVLQEIVERGTTLSSPAVLGVEPLSHAELSARARRLADMLRDLGVQAGDPVALALPQGVVHIVSLLAIRLAGAVIVPVNPLATPAELDHVLEDSGARLLLLSPGHSRAEGLAGDEGVVAVRIDRVSSPLGDDVDFVIYTSGSTGRPKGVILPQGAFAANIAAVAKFIGLSAQDRTIAFTPPNFALALSQIASHLASGGAVLPMARGLLNPGELLGAVPEFGITGLQLNPGALRTLMALLDDGIPPIQLRYLLLLGQPVSRAFAATVRQRFAGAELMLGYGCSENAPRVTMRRLREDPADQTEPLHVGSAIEGTEVSIRDEQGKALAADERGEICIRGTSLMRGYLGAEEETARRFVDGWFRTRDLGELDHEGNLRIVGRVDNIMLVGHEKVSPEDIEEQIDKLPGIVESAVCGRADPVYFEVPVALIVAVGPAPVADVRRHLRVALSRAKQPVRYHQVEAIPRTPYGKIDRVAVKRLVAELEQDGSPAAPLGRE